MIQQLKVMLQNMLKKSAFGRVVYPKIQKYWRSVVIPLRRKRLHKFGYDALNRLHNLLTEHSVVYQCEAGTLLGLIRDKGFIKHDDDIDICVPPGSRSLSEVLKIFLDAGYSSVQCLEYDGRLVEFTVRDRTGIPIDVFTCEFPADNPKVMWQVFPRWYPDRDYPNERANNMLQFEYVRPTGYKTMKVHGVNASIPENFEEVLYSEFGPWRVPDPTFKSEMLKHRELPEFAFRVTKEEALAM